MEFDEAKRDRQSRTSFSGSHSGPAAMALGGVGK